MFRYDPASNLRYTGDIINYTNLQIMLKNQYKLLLSAFISE